MADRRRLYDSILDTHLGDLRQMAFVSGPRQVGKTTVCRHGADAYLNWDTAADRRLIQKGADAVAKSIGADRARSGRPKVVFDEIHKDRRWKGFLKGFFDVYADRRKLGVVITGSARLNVYRRGGDSLMGRYFLYRMHPFSVAECLRTATPTALLSPPARIGDADWNALLRHGGFPEPFLVRSPAFTGKWARLRLDQLTGEDLRDLGAFRDLAGLDQLARILSERSSVQLNLAELARDLQVTAETSSRWVAALEQLHLGFTLRPWSKDIANSLRKEPRWFLRDWSGIDEVVRRAETFVGCHLLKAVEGWTDLGLGTFDLAYLRTKQGHEVDFVIIRDRKPWCLVEVKQSAAELSPSLAFFQERTKAPHAFQVEIDTPYEAVDCFAHRGSPLRVPARTFLSQLL
jgi:uncharacterized protein